MVEVNKPIITLTKEDGEIHLVKICQQNKEQL